MIKIKNDNNSEMKNIIHTKLRKNNREKCVWLKIEEYWNFYTNIKYGTEETIPELFDRVKEFLDDLKRQEYNTVLIVAHSGVSKAFSAYFHGIGDGLFLNRGLKNCKIKEYKL